MILSLVAGALIGQASDVLPDVSLLPSYLADAYVTTSNPELPAGTRALRFSTASVNYGNGRFELRGGTISGSTQLVNQRVYRSDGTFYDRPCGSFTYHAAHGHIHFDDWTIFRLRQVLPGGGVGPVVGTGEKTSFCILEIHAYNSSAPGHNTAPSYSSCGQIQGLRPGWADVYGSSLTGQYIELTGIPDGVYWLEGVVDPNNLVLESNPNNNTVRIQVAIGTPPAVVADPYEENDSRTQVDARTEGAPNSPNLGLIVAPRTLSGLSMDDGEDWFKFRVHAGDAGSYARMSSPYLRQGNLNLQLYNAAGTMIRQSADSYNYEQIGLDALPAGTYYLRVVRATTTNNPVYDLSVVPGPNQAPSLVLTQPFAGTVYREKSVETIPCAWQGTDPDNDPKLVTLYRSRVPSVDGSTVEITGYSNLPGGMHNVNINTADFGLGRWHILGIGTDGAAQALAWAPGITMLYKKGDTNFDGKVSKPEAYRLYKLLQENATLPDGWDKICDMDRDGDVDRQDYLRMLEEANNPH